MNPIVKIVSILLVMLCISCSNSDPVQGYIEGEYIYIAPNVSGMLVDMNVVRGQEVKKDQLLFALDPQPETDIKVAAQETIDQLKAEIIYAQAQLARNKKLYPQNAVDASSLDKTQSDFDSLRHQIAAATAQYKQAEWTLQQKTLAAPLDAQVVDVYFRPGENVQTYQPVLSLLAPRYIHVLFYVPEPLLHKIQIGQTISFTCDSCKKKTHAVIHYISPEAEYTPPIIYSEDVRYKLVYLIRADMPEDVAKQFHPGQPVDVFLHE